MLDSSQSARRRASPLYPSNLISATYLGESVLSTWSSASPPVLLRPFDGPPPCAASFHSLSDSLIPIRNAPGSPSPTGHQRTPRTRISNSIPFQKSGNRSQFRHPRRLAVLELNTLFPASSATRKNSKLFVDSPPARSTRKWRQTPRPAPRNIRCPTRSKFLYKNSGPHTATAQNSRRTPCVS
jgi:hypothetical protein